MSSDVDWIAVPLILVVYSSIYFREVEDQLQIVSVVRVTKEVSYCLSKLVQQGKNAFIIFVTYSACSFRQTNQGCYLLENCYLGKGDVRASWIPFRDVVSQRACCSLIAKNLRGRATGDD